MSTVTKKEIKEKYDLDKERKKITEYQIVDRYIYLEMPIEQAIRELENMYKDHPNAYLEADPDAISCEYLLKEKVTRLETDKEVTDRLQKREQEKVWKEKQQERERKEYERLKKKFEENQ